MDNPLYAGHRGRLRERFLAHGLAALQDYEAIELLLTYAIARRDVKPIAKAMFAKFGTIERILDATPEELLGIDGMGPASAGLLKLIKELCAKYLEQKLVNRDLILDTPRRVIDFCRMKLAGGKKETLLLLYLNAHHILIDYESVSGTVDRAAIYAREIVEKALLLHASGVIAAHNHPSGVCDPSNEDIDLTRTVMNALGTVGITLFDHFVITRNAAYSILRAKPF